MRRIIERVVTVVTTTTWKISWETDSSQTNQAIDPVSNDRLNPEVLSERVYDIQTGSDVIETKEVELPESEEKMTDQTAGEPLRESYPYPTKIERKSRS
jgi:hypothetical protein